MPEPSRPVIVNATPIIALSLIDHLELLRRLYEEVTIPDAVHREVFGKARRVGAVHVSGARWIRTVTLKDPGRADLLTDLNRGEAEVIALAQELDARLVILDERLGRRHARRLGLTLTGTLGVLLKSKAAGFVPEVGSLIQRLRDQGIRLSDPLVNRVLELAGESA